MTRKTDAPTPQRDWQSVIDANRQLDEAVAAIENAVWQAPAPPEIQPAAEKKRPTLTPVQPTFIRPTPIQPASPAAAPAFAAKPATGFPMALVFPPQPASPPPPPPQPVAEDLEDVAQALAAQAAELRRQRAALLADVAFVLPWSPTPRPVLTADGAPGQITDEELRDVIQPHWRALAGRAAAAAAQLAAARDAKNGESAWRRVWSGRAALRAAEQTDAAARQAAEAAGLIWESASLSERRAQMRAVAEQAREAAVAATPGVAELDQAIAATNGALALTAALRERGMNVIERRYDETLAQALARADAS